MGQEFSQPEAVSQYLLDETGAAYLGGDFDRFAACFHLPQHVATYGGTRELRNPDDLRDLFTSMRAMFALKGATHLDRRCLRAEFDGPDTVRAIHESRLMAGDKVIETAFPAFSILRRIDGVWKVTFSQYAVDQDISSALGTLGGDAGAHSTGEHA
jgi:hypothetical protein